jgi:hypothetical protein
MQRSGLEWAHRLASEPRRLAGRYLGRDAPYALRLLVSAARGLDGEFERARAVGARDLREATRRPSPRASRSG